MQYDEGQATRRVLDSFMHARRWGFNG